jgi:hypothetical protein
MAMAAETTTDEPPDGDEQYYLEAASEPAAPVAPAPAADDAVRSDGSAERALMRAVLEDAILCIGGPTGASRSKAELAREARAWVASEDRLWPYSFENICDVLGLAADTLRRRLLVDVDPTLLSTVRAGRRRGNPRPLPPRRRTTTAPRAA